MLQRIPWFVRFLAAFVIISSVVVTVVPATASGSLNLRAILRRAAIATAAQKSFHTQGRASLIVAEQLRGVSFSIRLGATFRGDASDWGMTPKAHLRGQFREGPLAKYFKIVDLGTELAGRYGKQPWSCTAIPVTTPKKSKPNPAELRVVHKYLTALERKVHVVSLGTTVDHGVSVWAIQASLVTRLDLTPLLGIAKATHALSVQHAVKFPKPWVHMKVTVWISQSKYTVQRLTTHVKVRIKHEDLILNVTDQMSRYGEHVPIVLPAKCAKS